MLCFKTITDENKVCCVIVGGCEWTNNNEWFNLCDTHKVIPETIGQFTGLYDKNNVEIYEGDIVIDREDEVIGDIVWNKEEASFYFSILYENGTYEEEKLNDWVEVLEVIGNTTDNKNLLEGE